MKGFVTLLLVALGVFAGYSHWQLTRLQADVKELKLAAAERRSDESVVVTEQKDAVLLLTQATENCRRARVYLDRGQTSKARQELTRSLQKLEEASKLSQRSSGGRDVGETWQEVKGQLDKLWQQFAEDVKPKKGS